VDETVSHPEYIDSSDMPSFPSHVHPAVSPAHNAALTKSKNLLDLDVDMGRLAEEVLPKMRALHDGSDQRVHGAVDVAGGKKTIRYYGGLAASPPLIRSIYKVPGGTSAASMAGSLRSHRSCRRADVRPAMATPVIKGEEEHAASKPRKAASAR
jgi:hypothetical protein